MCHAILFDSNFWDFLFRLDKDLAEQVRRAGCSCGGVLHSARYPRKPRGVHRSVLGQCYERRLSFCCAREGCRRRTTPPSVRYLHRRVYLAAVVVLVTALAQGLTGRRLARLREHFGLSVHTLRRWRRWWREHFPGTAFWRAAKSRFVPPVASETLPRSLLDRFAGENFALKLAAALQFLCPLSILSTHSLRVFAHPQKMPLPGGFDPA